MTVENPAALRFILDDDIYLLNKDKVVPAVAAATIAAPQLIETPVPVFKYMGGNKKNFLITVHYTDNEFIDEAHLAALENILKRKEISIDDVAILNIANHAAASFEELSNYFKPQKLLLMGRKALPGTMSAPLVNQIKQLNNCLSLYSFSFDEMMSSNENKRVFWEQMKNL